MRIIESYILRRITVLFLAVLFAAIGITWTVQVLARINFLTTSGQTFLTVLKFSSLFIPSAIPLVMPFALVIAIAQTLSTMNQDSELVVINASGAPSSSVWRPVLYLAVVISILSFVIANFVAPHARINMRDMVANAHSDLINVLIKEGNFRELSDNIYMEIGERHADGSIGRLFIADQRNPDLDLYYYAVNGAVQSNNRGSFLIMENGEVQRHDNKSGDVSIIKFNSYTFDLGEFSPAGDSVLLFPKDQSLSFLLNPDPNDANYQRRPNQYTAELHRRCTEWIYPFIFALIALAVAGDARSHREARISASFSAISLSLIAYWLGYFFGDRADNDLAFIPLLYLSPLVIGTISAFLIFTHRRLGLPAGISDRIANFVDLVKKRFDLGDHQNSGGTTQ